MTKEAFLVKDDRVLRAARSLATFVSSHHSLCSLAPQRSDSLCLLRLLAPFAFTGSLTHFAHSLVGQLKFFKMCSHCYRVSREQTPFWRSLETRPLLMNLISRFPVTFSHKHQKWSLTLAVAKKKNSSVCNLNCGSKETLFFCCY